MTARTLVHYDGTNIKAMTSAEMVETQKRMIYAYGASPTVALTVDTGSAGNLTAMSDTRLKAGATSQSSTAFVAEGTTAEPGTVTVTYDAIHLAYTSSGSISKTADDGDTFPMYLDGSNNLQALNLADFKDTLLHPAIDLMIASADSDNTAKSFTITNSSTAATGYTNVSTTAVFTDTRADTSAYSAAGIPETLDQPSTITNYYLHQKNNMSAPTPSVFPLVTDSSGNLNQMSTSTIDSVLGAWLRFTAAHSTDGYKITYDTATSGGNTKGTAMVDTKLDGSGNYQTLQSGDDYRSQEFPNGSAATVTTYNLRINKG
jgi:hypothetical protein|tara:strand:- start:446 stop:1396 length:951 start_codon:yes stop_codon:yes gene_type:complete